VRANGLRNSVFCVLYFRRPETRRPEGYSRQYDQERAKMSWSGSKPSLNPSLLVCVCVHSSSSSASSSASSSHLMNGSMSLRNTLRPLEWLPFLYLCVCVCVCVCVRVRAHAGIHACLTVTATSVATCVVPELVSPIPYCKEGYQPAGTRLSTVTFW